jgi:ubiquinone/menaquinone biosynthesis C-methylase UbiE
LTFQNIRTTPITRFFSFFLTIFLLFIIVRLLADQSSKRDKWQQPERILNILGIEPGMIIGEVGAGEGYFTFKLSSKVGDKGIIYANDIVESKLNKIRKRCEKERIRNIKTVLGEMEDPGFPQKNLDMIIMVYVLHDLEKPIKLLENLKGYLKEQAPLVIIERDPDKFGGRNGHFMLKEEVLQTVQSAGYQLSKIETFLSRDNIYIYLAE